MVRYGSVDKVWFGTADEVCMVWFGMVYVNKYMNDNDIHPLLNIIPGEQIQKVFNQDYCDIDCHFLGFTETYEKLSQIIPKDFTVIDLGCSYNAQSFYFIHHYRYIAVDINHIERFCAPNCIIFEKSIEEFIREDLDQFSLDKVFAICNYVPRWRNDNNKLVRENFRNIFTFYPA